MKAQRRIGLGIVGAGRWGRNYVRTLAALPTVDLRWVCDIDPLARARVLCVAPSVQTVAELPVALRDPQLDAVVVATSAARHPACALAALAAGKHVLLEKPMALSVSEARELAARASSAHRTLLVGHVMLYHPAVEALRARLAEGALGTVERVFARRTNVAGRAADHGALWSLAPHDLSLVDAIFGREPVLVAAHRPRRGSGPGEDAVLVELAFAGGAAARIEIAEGAAQRVRRLVVVGTARIAVFDEDARGARLHLYARDRARQEAAVRVPLPDEPAEPLRTECEHFLRCIADGVEPRCPAEHGVRVVRWLAAAERSLLLGGRPVELSVEGPTVRPSRRGASRVTAPG